MSEGLNNKLNNVSRGLMDFLFPRRCPFCGAVAGKALLCARCEGTLPRCAAVRTDASFGRCAAPLYYEGAVRKAILDYKFKGAAGGIDCFGRLMAQCAAEQFSGAFDAVTWVPVSQKRLRKRGYDQSRFLAASLCVDWHTEPQETLKKTVDNPPQSTLEGLEVRRANVLGVYEAVKPEEIANKRFLLVDDILTTGATLGECVRVLRCAGATDVVCLVLAMGREKEE